MKTRLGSAFIIGIANLALTACNTTPIPHCDMLTERVQANWGWLSVSAKVQGAERVPWLQLGIPVGSNGGYSARDLEFTAKATNGTLDLTVGSFTSTHPADGCLAMFTQVVPSISEDIPLDFASLKAGTEIALTLNIGKSTNTFRLSYSNYQLQLTPIAQTNAQVHFLSPYLIVPANVQKLVLTGSFPDDDYRAALASFAIAHGFALATSAYPGLPDPRSYKAGVYTEIYVVPAASDFLTGQTTKFLGSLDSTSGAQVYQAPIWP